MGNIQRVMPGYYTAEDMRIYENTKNAVAVRRICFALRVVFNYERAFKKAQAMSKAMKEFQEARQSNEVSEV